MKRLPVRRGKHFPSPLQAGMLGDMRVLSTCPWRPSAPPDLSGIDDIVLDVESTGLRWFDKDRPIGFAVGWPDGDRWITQYLPFGHLAGGNLEESTVKRWAQHELKNKRITNLGVRFDNHMFYVWGVDLEAQGCVLSDVGHYAALLNNLRTHFSLESLSLDFLGEGKVKGLDVANLKEYHAGEVAAYAEQDVALAGRLKQHLWPLLGQEDLHKVRTLEEELIYVVCEMERNAAPIDRELLRKMVIQSEREYLKCITDIKDMTGMAVNPRSPIDADKLFRHIGIEVARTRKGYPVLDELSLKQIKHPVVRLFHRARHIGSVRAKYLLKYDEETAGDGMLRYALHQLSTDSREESGTGGGTVTGRFSSSGFGTDAAPDGVNIQQVMTPEKQEKLGIPEYEVRQLFVPKSGLWLAADASQIEYRLFAHFSNSPKIIDAYKKDPRTNFHKLVQSMIQTVRPDIDYRRTKDTNFAKIFGAGLEKIAYMLELSVDDARHFVAQYDAMFPEIPLLIDRATKLAEERGWVKTLLGRRARFPDKEWCYKALNAVIQGSAADINKLKGVELYKRRKELGLTLRFTVHDEWNMDVPDLESARIVEEVLNSQSIELRVPIFWDVGTGRNWREAKSK